MVQLPLYDVVIIGLGPAGLQAAIYTARANLKTVIFGYKEKSNLFKSHTVGNYFGFPYDAPGPELMAKGLEQAKKFKTEFVEGEIVHLSINDDQTFTLKDNNLHEYQTKNVIISTGLPFKNSGIQHERELANKGVSYCVTCDGFFFKNKKVAVIGYGHFAAEEAINLLIYTPHVTILSHGQDFAFGEEVKKELTGRGVTLKRTAKIKKFLGEEKMTGLEYSDGGTESFDGVFMAIGSANSQELAQKIGVATDGPVIVINKQGETNIPGVYAAGDCTGGSAQVAISVGQGCAAALSVIKRVRGLKAYVQYN